MRRVFLQFLHDLIWRKNGSKTRMTYSTHKRKFLSKNPLFEGTVYKICMLCTFRLAETILLWKCLKMDVGKSKIVWSRNNGCHMSQKNVIKFGFAFHTWFLDSCSILRFSEQSEWNVLHLYKCPWASAEGGQNGHLPPLEIESKRQDFLENKKLVAQFRSID